MTARDPNLLTLLQWSHQLAAGKPCVTWEQWYRASPRAARRWEQLAAAEERLASGSAPTYSTERGATELGAADVAEYIDGDLPPAAAQEVEKACWRSLPQLCEVASAARFARDSAELAEVSGNLTQRLLSIGPRAAQRRNGRALRLVAAEAAPAPSAVSSAVVATPRRQVARRPNDAVRHWPLAAAAAVLVMAAIGGALSWWMSLTVGIDRDRVPIAKEPATLPARQDDYDRPLVIQIVTPAPPAPLPEPMPPEGQPSPAPPPQVATDVPQTPAPPKHAIPGPAPASHPEMTIQSAIGALLVDPGNRGPLRVAKGQYMLTEPVRLVSLAESWSSIEIPNVGTLVCDGPAEATFASWGDGVLEIQLTYGKLGVQRLPAGQRIRFQTGGAQWQARGVGNYSTLAVVHDPLAPSLAVPLGAVAVDDVPVAAKQFVRFAAGAVQPPQPLAVDAAASVSEPLAGFWLAPPDEARRKKWQAQHGKLLEKLTIIDDVGSELPALLAASKDARQAALLSQWNLSVADEATRVKQTWALLGDHRELVRAASMRYLIELPASDQRVANIVRYVRSQFGDDLGNRVAQWLKAAHQPGQLPATQAVELAEFLGHRDLAVRHLAVSLLELHSGPALARARRVPPPFDAAGPTAKRAAAQREWRQLIRQLFAPARNAPAAQVPNVLAPNAGNMQPALK